MPELPEVEVVKKSLEKEIKQSAIKDIKIIDGRLRYKVNKRKIRKLIGLRISKVQRMAKYLLFHFNKKDLAMLIHLGMTGKFFIKKKNHRTKKTSFYYHESENDIKHDRLIFFFKNNTKLIYNDVRKFGFIKVILNQEIKRNKHLNILGPEPLSINFNFNYFKTSLEKKKDNIIKNLLMDQKFVSGLGNIYVNEVLFLSNISPQRLLKKLSDNEIKKILFNTKKILKKAILFGGSSIKDFSNSIGKKGNFQQHFNVYGRNGSKCSNTDCKGVIKKIKISNRSSFFCVKCQK